MSKPTRFTGFPPDRQTWDFPNVIDGYVRTLSGPEFKVLWYILRHTSGWQKTEDTISYTQFQSGIQRKDGTWLDRGTGLSRPAISKALKVLVERGFIERSGKGSGRTNSYRLKYADSDQLSGFTTGGKQGEPTIPNIQSLRNNKNILDLRFESIWKKYPSKDGKKAAMRHFRGSVKTEADWTAINKALDNYLTHLKANEWKRAKNGSTWFNNWTDWVDWREPGEAAAKPEPNKEACKKCGSTSWTSIMGGVCRDCRR